jgi:hypothetical protein
MQTYIELVDSDDEGGPSSSSIPNSESTGSILFSGGQFESEPRCSG